MVPVPYRLDTLAVLLIARLEPTRRAHEDPTRAAAQFRRIVEDAARAVAAECRETTGDTVQAARIEREAAETFLPRYARLALAQNAQEARGFGFPFGEGPFARVLATVLAFLAVALLWRLPLGAFRFVFVFAALVVPLLPEVRVLWSRRRHRAALQELADDMGRIQDAEAELPLPPPLPEAPPETEAPPEAPRRPAPQKERP